MFAASSLERPQRIGEAHIQKLSRPVELEAVDLVRRAVRNRGLTVLHHQQSQRVIAGERDRNMVNAVGIANAVDQEGTQVAWAGPVTANPVEVKAGVSWLDARSTT